MNPTQKRVVAAAAGAMVLACSVGIALVAARLEGFEGVSHAFWFEGAGQPSLLVTGYRNVSPESGSSYVTYGFVLLDPDTGEITQRETFGQDGGFAGSATAPRVRTTSGPYILYTTTDALVLRNATTGDELEAAALMRRWPMIAAPWYQTRVVGPGTLAIEADDRRWWSVDIASRHATPAAAPAGSADVRGCVGIDWPKDDGKVWTFEHVTPERHSDPNDWGLVRATRLEYGQIADVEPLGLRLPYAWFHCDQRTRRTALFPDGSALIGTWSKTSASTVGVAKLGADQRLAWRWDSGIASGPNLVVEAFGHEGGFIVVIGTRITSLAGDGRVRWSVGL